MVQDYSPAELDRIMAALTAGSVTSTTSSDDVWFAGTLGALLLADVRRTINRRLSELFTPMRDLSELLGVAFVTDEGSRHGLTEALYLSGWAGSAVTEATLEEVYMAHSRTGNVGTYVGNVGTGRSW